MVAQSVYFGSEADSPCVGGGRGDAEGEYDPVVVVEGSSAPEPSQGAS